MIKKINVKIVLMFSLLIANPTNYDLLDSSNEFICIHTHITRNVENDNEFGHRYEIIKNLTEYEIHLIRTGFVWKNIEKEIGHYDWTITDSVVALTNKENINILGLLHGIPDWAKPIELHLDDWYNFIDSVMIRYGGRIHEWEIWNEPNLEKYWAQDTPDSIFVSLVKITYHRIKNFYPDHIVILGGLANGKEAQGFKFWESIFRLGVLDYIDAIAIHPYNNRGIDLIEYVSDLKKMISNYSKIPKDIFVTEFGRSTHNIDENTQANTILKTALVYWVLEGKRFIIFEFMDNTKYWKIKKYGIHIKDMSPRKSVNAIVWLNHIIKEYVPTDYWYNEKIIILKIINEQEEIEYISWGNPNKESFMHKFDIDLSSYSRYNMFGTSKINYSNGDIIHWMEN